MATIQTTAKIVSSGLANEIVDAISEEYGYQATIANPAYAVVDGVPNGQPETITNPQTKAQFTQEKLDEFAYTWVKNIVVTRRRRNVVVDTTTAGL